MHHCLHIPQARAEIVDPSLHSEPWSWGVSQQDAFGNASGCAEARARRISFFISITYGGKPPVARALTYIFVARAVAQAAVRHVVQAVVLAGVRNSSSGLNVVVPLGALSSICASDT